MENEKPQNEKSLYIEVAGQNNEQARHAANEEHSQGLWQALKREPKSVFWSVAVSTAM